MKSLYKFKFTFRDLRFFILGILISLMFGAHAMSQYVSPQGPAVTIIAPTSGAAIPYTEQVNGKPIVFNFAPNTSSRPPTLGIRTFGSAQIVNNEYVCTYPYSVKGHNFTVVLETPIPPNATDVHLADGGRAVEFYL